MKKISLLLFILIANALSLNAQVVFGPEGGVSVCSMTIQAPTPFRTLSNGSIIGAKAGGILDVNMSSHLYFQTGLFFDIKGNSKSFGVNTPADSLFAHVDERMQINYLSLPINVLFKTGIQGRGRIFFGLGATISYVVGGQDLLHNYGHESGNSFQTNAISQVVGGETVTRADAGLNFMAGYEFRSGLFLRSYYYYGFTDIAKVGDESDKNLSYGISIGYLLGDAKRKSPVNELMAE